MRTKPQTTAIVICFAVLSMQFISCKKDTANSTIANSAESIENAAASGPVTDSSLKVGLVAWYTFNGDVLDHSGLKNNVIFNSAKATAGKSGVPRTAYLFDGASSYMQVANSKSINPLKITLYALVKPKGFYQGTCHYNRVICKGYNDYDNGRYSMGFDDQAYYNYTGCDLPVLNGKENFYGSYGNGTGATGATDLTQYVKANQWYSLVYTFDGVNSKLYVNGILVNRIIRSTSFTANTNPLFIGRNQDPGYPYYFNGVIDEIRIYKRVLNQAEVSALFSNN